MHPAKAIASPIDGIKSANRYDTHRIKNVYKTFSFLLIFLLFKNNSSTVSFAGNTHNGVAAKTDRKEVKFPL